jgi:hypothetical protein
VKPLGSEHLPIYANCFLVYVLCIICVTSCALRKVFWGVGSKRDMEEMDRTKNIADERGY